MRVESTQKKKMKGHETCLLSKQNDSWHLLSSSKIAEIGSSIFDGFAFVCESVGFPCCLSYSKKFNII
jgi:hypothetical protein